MEEYKPTGYGEALRIDDISRAIYEYNKRKNENQNLNYQGLQNYGLDALLKADQGIVEEEVDSIEHQIAEREKIKRRNVCFLEEQRQKIEEFLNRTECFTYKPSGLINAVRGKLVTQLVQVELKKGEEYVNAFKDVQRLEEQKRRILADEKADAGWL